MSSTKDLGWLCACKQFLQGLSTCPGLHREDFLKTESQLILLAWITKTTFESLILIHIYCKRAVRYTSPQGSKAQGQGYRDNSISLYLADSSQQQSRQRHHQPVFNFFLWLIEHYEKSLNRKKSTALKSPFSHQDEITFSL